LAQSTNSGDIRGIVTDPSGALIPNATVNILNVETGVSKDFVTNKDGLFDTSSIVTGSYKVTFTVSGFETLVRGPVTVQVGFTTVDAQMKVGTTSQEVTVSTDVPLLQTESGEQSTTFESKSMSQLPQVTQDWENFMILLPGASGAVGGSQGSSNPGQEVASMATCPTAISLPTAPPPRSRTARMRILPSLKLSLNFRSILPPSRPSMASAA